MIWGRSGKKVETFTGRISVEGTRKQSWWGRSEKKVGTFTGRISVEGTRKQSWW